jgi:hypothetical protein
MRHRSLLQPADILFGDGRVVIAQQVDLLERLLVQQRLDRAGANLAFRLADHLGDGLAFGRRQSHSHRPQIRMPNPRNKHPSPHR